MDRPRPCGCKGRRTCLICEIQFGISSQHFCLSDAAETSYVYCPWCQKAWPGWQATSYQSHPDHPGTSVNFPGIFLQLDFLSPEEEDVLLKGIDQIPWDLSQSGRRKQNFGPKCNFKKQRLKLGDFHGFPLFTKFVQDKFEDVPILKGFRTVEQCTLEYDPARGSSIDPHVDDCWVWGERIVTVNLLSDSVLTMTHYSGNPDRYNVKCISTYPPILNEKGEIIYEPFLSEKICKEDEQDETEGDTETDSPEDNGKLPIVRIPMPARSLLLLYGPARYNWEHRVLRTDIKERRLCLSYREFTPTYMKGGKHANIGSEILEAAENFWDNRNLE